MARAIKPSDLNDLIKAQQEQGLLSYTENVVTQQQFPGLIYPASSERFGQVRSFAEYNKARAASKLPAVNITTYRQALQELKNVGKAQGRYGRRAEKEFEKGSYKGAARGIAEHMRGNVIRDARERTKDWYAGERSSGNKVTPEEYYDHLISEIEAIADEWEDL